MQICYNKNASVQRASANWIAFGGFLTRLFFYCVGYAELSLGSGRLGALAQLGAHNTGSVGVTDSSPVCSMKTFLLI